MYLDEPRARVGYQGGALSRVKNLALKVFLVLASAVTLVSAFVVSLVFVAIGVAVVMIVGGVLWWKTRALRGQIRAQLQEMQDRPPPGARGRVIEGEVLSRDNPRR